MLFRFERIGDLVRLEIWLGSGWIFGCVRDVVR